jgi:hypothetical protein
MPTPLAHVLVTQASDLRTAAAVDLHAAGLGERAEALIAVPGAGSIVG